MAYKQFIVTVLNLCRNSFENFKLFFKYHFTYLNFIKITENAYSVPEDAIKSFEVLIARDYLGIDDAA